MHDVVEARATRKRSFIAAPASRWFGVSSWWSH
jgi:hypothetical protein